MLLRPHLMLACDRSQNSKTSHSHLHHGRLQRAWICCRARVSQILMVLSDEQDANTFSSDGLHCISSTEDVWPCTNILLNLKAVKTKKLLFIQLRKAFHKHTFMFATDAFALWNMLQIPFHWILYIICSFNSPSEFLLLLDVFSISVHHFTIG